MFCSIVLLLSAFTGSVFGGDEGPPNVFYGSGAGASITSGFDDTFLGIGAGFSNTTGIYNTFVGYDAGYDNTGGIRNTFVGGYAGTSSSTGDFNTFLGYQAGYSNTTGGTNTFVGQSAGYANTIGGNNTFVGENAGVSNTNGISNTFVGRFAGRYGNGSGNTLVGNEAGFSNSIGWRNTMVGEFAGWNNITGGGNVFIGWSAGSNETGSDKLYINNSDTATPLIYGEFDNEIVTINGKLGIGTKTPTQKIDLGQGEITVNGADNTGEMPPGMYSWENGRIDFGFGGAGGGNLEAYSKGHARAGQFKFIYGGGDFGSIVYAHYDPARQPGYQWLDMMTLDKDGYLHMAGGAWTNGLQWIDASSRAYKENIRSLSVDEAMETLKELSPVKFSYKTDSRETHVGFIAEEVPALVATGDKKGMSPMDVVAVLTKVVQEQQKTISALSEELKELKGKVK